MLDTLGQYSHDRHVGHIQLSLNLYMNITCEQFRTQNNLVINLVSVNPVWNNSALRTQPVCALRTQPVCALRTQPVSALRTQPVCALRTQSVCALRTQPVSALRTQPVCALRTQPEIKDIETLDWVFVCREQEKGEREMRDFDEAWKIRMT
ncbi:hypothetical protein Tco_1126339 [Tanacetum coccineum]